MGRRKIEIKAIKDDRNRSVTFLKRKGGLFKKAHELSVLCSVDVAVIIFGNNKKLYEYSSSDIGEVLNRYQFYGGANEHKGPADFSGKVKDEDDDDDDDGSGMSQHGGPPVEQQMLPPQFQSQPAFQHIKIEPPSASPPIANGAFHPHPSPQHTPQHDSRPSSRNAPGRQSSNLVPQQHAHPQPPNGYAFMPNPPMYNPHQAGLPPHPHNMPPHMQAPPMQGPPMQAPHHVQQAPQYPNYGPPQQHPQQHPQQQHPHPQHPQPQHPQQQHPQQQHPQPQHPQPQHQQHPHPQQVHQIYAGEQRKASVPRVFPQQERLQIKTEGSPLHPQEQQVTQSQPEHQEEEQQPPQPPPEQKPDPVKRMSKSRSIFTPIDESRSILSQHWASSTSSGETPRSGMASSATSNIRSQSIDAGAAPRPPIPPQSPANPRNAPTSSTPEGMFQPPSRTNSASMGGGKRPVLKVQIPDGESDGESAVGDSPRSASNATQAQRNGQSVEHHSGSGVVLPPPSPSASALLSAGASGPPNPFARPHPVSGPPQNSNAVSMIETPVSALPSRFMTNEFLPSPSSFYPDWNFSREGNTLPSPLNFATPVVGTGPSFLREDSGERDKPGNSMKRKSPEAENDDGDDGGDSKRSRLAA